MQVYGTAGNTSDMVKETQESKINKALGKEEFLKLLITELRYQDATNPMQDREFIAQMAQMSSLEQMQNLNKTFEDGLYALAEAQQNYSWNVAQLLEVMLNQTTLNSFGQGLNLLGHEVSYIEGGEEKTGIVSSIKQVDGRYLAIIEDKEVAFTDLISVR